jgi:8-oxo-dGTP pyrophosphatase MutT (NUDIX family)
MNAVPPRTEVAAGGSGRGLRWRLQRIGLLGYRLLPLPMRRLAVRTVSPTYTAGSLVVIEADDGSVVLIRHTYRKDWGLPGGLLNRGEQPAVAAVREVREEIGIEVDLAGPPRVVMDPGERRLDFVYRARVRPGSAVAVEPCSAELAEARWFRRESFPPLHADAASALAALVDEVALPFVPAARSGRGRAQR